MSVYQRSSYHVLKKQYERLNEYKNENKTEIL